MPLAVSAFILAGCVETRQADNTVQVPQVHTLPDFKQYRDIRAKKQAFFDFLRPIVEAENRLILADRARILALREQVQQGRVLSNRARAWLQALAERYKLSLDVSDSLRVDWDALLARVDEIPLTLVLAQAANESAWGTSRFAREGNNLFGQWCFSRGCGLVPTRRVEGARHEVARFATVNESVRSYLLNLNSHRVYQGLRALRSELRRQGQPLSGVRLSEGLRRYSERGQAYVDELQAMIETNRPLMLESLDS